MTATSLRPAAAADRPAIEQLWQLYMHDLSQFRGTLPDAHGRYRTERLLTFFADPDRCAYVIEADGARGGFAFVRGLQHDSRVVGEFFVVRALRRRHVGFDAALAMLATHPGRWEIPFQEDNAGAARFWRQVATAAVGDAWHEEPRPVPGKPHVQPDVWLTLTT